MMTITERFDFTDVRTPIEISDGVPQVIVAETAGGISTEITAPWARGDGWDGYHFRACRGVGCAATLCAERRAGCP